MEWLRISDYLLNLVQLQTFVILWDNFEVYSSLVLEIKTLKK